VTFVNFPSIDSLNESNIICESGNFIDIDDLEFEKEILKIGMADEVSEKVERLQVPSSRTERRTKSRFMSKSLFI